MVLRRQQSNCSTPPHSVPWGQKHVVSEVCKERDSRPCLHEEDQSQTQTHRSQLLWKTTFKHPHAGGAALFWLSFDNRKIEPFSEKWRLPNAGMNLGQEEAGLKTTFILILPIILLSFPLLRLPASQPSFQKNPFTFLSFYNIPLLSTDLLSLSPFPFSENICSHVQ